MLENRVQPLASLLKDASGAQLNNIVLAAIADKGWIVKADKEPELFLTASQLQAGKLTEKEFYDIAKAWCTLANLPSGVHLETARGLAPESVRITTVVKEVVEDGFDDHEVTYLQADSMVAREFLQEDIAPFMEFLEKGHSDTFPLDLLRRKRAEVKVKLETQKKNANVHLQRAQKGLTILKEGGLYHIYTNHLPRYAAACALECLLRAYYSLLGSFDPEDVMVDNDWQNLLKTTEGSAKKIVELYDQYAQARKELLTTKFERDGRNCSFFVHDAGAAQDRLVPKVDLQTLAGTNTCASRLQKNGALEYYCESIITRVDKTTGPGRKLYEAALKSMQFSEDPTVWNTKLEPHVENMATVIEVALKRRSDILQQFSHYRAMGGLENLDTPQKPLPKCIPYKQYIKEKEKWQATMPAGYVLWQGRMLKLPFAICRVAGGIYPEDLQDTGCNIAAEGVKYEVWTRNSPDSIDILVDITGFSWVKGAKGSIPDDAVPMGLTRDKKPLYIARGYAQHGSALFKISGIIPGSICQGMTGYQYESREKTRIGLEYEVLCYGSTNSDSTTLTPLEKQQSASALEAQIASLQKQLASLKQE